MLTRTSFAIFVSAAIMVAVYLWASDATWLMPDLLDDGRTLHQQVAAISTAGAEQAAATCTGAGPC